MPVIEFTVVQAPTEAMRVLGAGGMLVTSVQLTPRIIDALNKFWMEHADEYEDGDSFTIEVSYDA
ncbi:hypothetical protein KIP88_02955 [Bradyrhizobium sp. SRL28]|uniref:hypothetical protein n=1 Tax=Bradyrhizobium sp. SRL28 TaxID=2836178 RepID=UPI001BDDEC23|nr:hypothetical protein [Bradyrhizobium sp. SRL28]MBT1509451.1 hypothetical protein [Bradyrhizobium sp. SRL28]